MKTKISICIVLAVVALFGYFFYSGGFSGSKTLTRDKAAQMILTALQKSPDLKGEGVTYEAKSGTYASIFVSDNELLQLQTAGLIKLTRTTQQWCPNCKTFILTDKGKPYSQSFGDFGYISLAVPSSVEVTGITVPSMDADGRKVVTADYTAHYQPTPFGEIIKVINNVSFATTVGDIKNTASFILYDDGWRIGN